MKNKIEDLRNHLFEQLERLGDDDAMKDPSGLERELKRSHAISEVSEQIIASAKAETEFLRATGRAPETPFIPLDVAGNKPKAIEGK